MARVLGNRLRSARKSGPRKSTHVRVAASHRHERAKGLLLDEASIREFLVAHYPRLVAALTLMAGSRPAAEDAVQEALARAWERGERGEGIESPEAWVRTVAVNLVRSSFRRLRAERRARDELGRRAQRPISSVSDDERIDMARALAGLPRRQREVTVLAYYLQLSVDEIARTLRVSEGTVKTSLHRARRRLAEALGPQDLEEVHDPARR